MKKKKNLVQRFIEHCRSIWVSQYAIDEDGRMFKKVAL